MTLKPTTHNACSENAALLSAKDAMRNAHTSARDKRMPQRRTGGDGLSHSRRSNDKLERITRNTKDKGKALLSLNTACTAAFVGGGADDRLKPERCWRLDLGDFCATLRLHQLEPTRGIVFARLDVSAAIRSVLSALHGFTEILSWDLKLTPMAHDVLLQCNRDQQQAFAYLVANEHLYAHLFTEEWCSERGCVSCSLPRHKGGLFDTQEEFESSPETMSDLSSSSSTTYVDFTIDEFRFQHIEDEGVFLSCPQAEIYHTMSRENCLKDSMYQKYDNGSNNRFALAR